MKNGRAPGSGDVGVEMIKSEIIDRLCNQYIKNEKPQKNGK